MTKATLKMIADEIKDNVPYQDGKWACAHMIVDIAKKQNKRFNEEKFLRDCGLVTTGIVE